jgi:hypothetical protein
MRQINASGEITKSGYFYRVYLPNSAGEGVREQPTGGYLAGDVDPDLSEVVWVCYAWPNRYGITGRRTFFVGQLGEIFFTEDPDYTGPDCAGITPGSALLTANPDTITAFTAVGTIGHDGNLWRPAQ